MTVIVEVPEELSARVPVEQRGPGLERDAVRLLVSRGTEVSHHAFVELPGLLRAGDLLVVNTSPTLAAAVGGRSGTRVWWCTSPRAVTTAAGRSSCGTRTAAAPHPRARVYARGQRCGWSGVRGWCWRSR
ncbi:hypothetical protein SHKM778_67150 [Streptomyces sp. KM77-8]|uniref:S-adenosylmethionine:tRNA ribosyltransferase-isomerase n=1 Tax=Streptomyces haneummycinicus TaxID=3074435 RepID=A0AAT9HSC3_9ACTN